MEVWKFLQIGDLASEVFQFSAEPSFLVAGSGISAMLSRSKRVLHGPLIPEHPSGPVLFLYITRGIRSLTGFFYFEIGQYGNEGQNN